MKFDSSHPLLVTPLLAAACITSPAYAADGTWDNGAATQNWQDAANWNPDGLPGVNTDVFTSTETATFSTTGSGIINLGNRINIRDIRFGSGAGDANAFIIGDADDTLNLSNAATPGTNGMTLMGTGVTNTQQMGVAGTTIKLSSTISSQYWFTNNSTTSAAKLNIAGNITTAAASGTSVLTLNGANGGTVSGTITNGGTANLALTKSGAGTWTLTGANEYTGTTTISGGTLALSGGNNRLATTGPVNFSAAGTLDVGSTEQTLANMTVGNTITGTVTGTTGGKLTLTGSSFALGGGTSQTNTLNLSGLPTFTYNNSAGTFRVSGVSTGAGGAGVLTLAGGANTITASTFGLGDFGSANNTSVNSGTANLGTTNTINANTITIGGNRGAGTLRYLSGTNTLLTLRGSDGTSRVTSMTLSETGGPNISGVQGTVDLTGNVTGTSTLDAMITTLTIGKNTRNAGAGGNTLINTGTFTMGAGTLDATTIILAQNTAGFTSGGTTSKTTGNLTVGTGGTIKVSNFYFADQNTSGSTGSALEANFNLNGGANLYAANIAKGSATGTHTATRTFNWNDGTIRNYDASTDLIFGSGITVKLASTGTHAFDIDSSRTATVDSVLSDATTLGTLTKAGSGTLNLNAANTYTGTTTISGGILALSGGNNRLATTGSVNFSGASTLDVGSTSQTLANITVANGVSGIVTGATGTLILGANHFLLGGTAAGTSAFDLSGLGTFQFNGSTRDFTVGDRVTGTATSTSTLTLGGANAITALNLFVGDAGGLGSSTTARTATLNLGKTNTINATTINVGKQTSSTATLQFAAGLDATTLTLRGTAGGSSRADMLIGSQGTGSSPVATAAVTGLVDLTNVNGTGGSTLDAMIGTLIIGQNSRTGAATSGVGSATGTFKMGAGTLDATTIVVGQDTSGGSYSNGATVAGTFTTGSGSVRVGTLTIGDKRSSSNSIGITSNFDLSNGGILQATTIADGANANTNVTRNFNWNDGTIQNIAGSDLTISSTATGAQALKIKLASTGTHTFDIESGRTGTVSAQLIDATTGGTLAKAGAGTLILNAANSYTGTTTVRQGTLALGTSGTISSTLVLGTSGGGTGSLDVTSKSSFTQANVSGNGSLGIGAGKTINVTTSLASGFSTGTLSVIGNLALAGTTTTTMELAGLGGILGVDSDYVSVTGDFTLDGILSIVSYGGFNLAQEGTYNLFDASTFTGDFDSVFVGGLGLTRVNDLWNASSGGLDYSFNEATGVLAVVPEPGPALLGGLGLLVLLRRRRN
jgi:autotransporter-associated beta strand protein